MIGRTLLVAAWLVTAGPGAVVEAAKKNKGSKKKNTKTTNKATKKPKKTTKATKKKNTKIKKSTKPTPPQTTDAPTQAAVVCGAPDDRIGNGWCDDRYNTPECSYDGGDCCDIFGAELFDCKDPDSEWMDLSSPTNRYPAPRNARYDEVAKSGMRVQSAKSLVQTYNNYYEFGFDKNIWPAAVAAAPMFNPKTFMVEIGGLVNNPIKISASDLINKFRLEERVYRHRCVEGWSIVVPWTGFELENIVRLVDPKEEAKYVKFTSWFNPMVSQPQNINMAGYNWPYVEALTIEEARHELAFISTGQYGAALPPQSGAPLRLNVPWKYGLKSIKAISKIEFVAARPVTFWESTDGGEYGFWSNVNPNVPHARWSQATERQFVDSTTFYKSKPTDIFNGYSDFIGDLYANYSASERLYT